MQNAQNIWLGHPATAEEACAICQNKAPRLGYQAALHGGLFNPDLITDEPDQRRYEESREVAVSLVADGCTPDWPLDRLTRPRRLVETILG